MNETVKAPQITNTHPENNSKSNSTINKVVLVSLVIVAISILRMLTWALQSSDVVTVNKVPIPSRVVQDKETGYGVVLLDIDTCKHTDSQGNVRTSFVSSTSETFLPLSKDRSPKGCSNATVSVPIPKDLPSDDYKIRLRATYTINPLKKNIIEEFESSPVHIEQFKTKK